MIEDGSRPGRGRDRSFMERALALAVQGLGETNPNPLVGCVVVKGGRIVGEGWHRRAGGPHAEVLALREAGARARGATLYVNLEPCVHQGRTPPCVEAVLASGVCRVVAALRDPNHSVRGRGFSALRRAGLAVTTGVLGGPAAALNEPFLVAARRQSPYVLLKVAMTLDGRIATARGHSQWITSRVQRAAARSLRRRFDGVVVGVGTVIADDPLLLPRPAVGRPFHRIVLDSSLRTPLGSRLVATARRWPVTLLCHNPDPWRRRRLEARGVTVLDGPREDGRLPAGWVLQALWGRGLWSVMVEGGSEVLGSFLAARLFDQIVLFRAPLILGGRGSLPAFGGPDPARIEDALRLDPVGAEAGPDGSAAGLPGCERWRPRSTR